MLEKVLQIPKDDPNRWQSETENPWLYHCFDEFTTTIPIVESRTTKTRCLVGVRGNR